MKTKIIIQTFVFLLVITSLISFVSAISISMDIKSSFNIGEEISFDYTITSETTADIEYIVSVDCPSAPIPLLEIKHTSLTANIPFKENYIYMSGLSDDIEPQTCKAIVSILSPKKSEEKSFELKTNPSFDFNILICKDELCSEKASVFILNENIYLKYNSDISDLNVEATLTSPNKQKKQLVLPAQIKAEQIGTYELEINATKTGYKTINKKVQFGVIEKEPDIQYLDFSALKEKNIFNQISKNPLLVAGLGAGVIVIGVVIFFIVRKRRMK